MFKFYKSMHYVHISKSHQMLKDLDSVCWQKKMTTVMHVTNVKWINTGKIHEKRKKRQT